MKELNIERLHIAVGDQEIVRGLTLRVPRGEVHALMGPNGSGKSTLAKVLAGHPDYRVTAGKILMDGEDLLELEPDERARRGLFLAFQYPSEIPGVTIANFLRAALQSRLPEGGELEATEDGVARDGSFIHVAGGQRGLFRRRKEAHRDSTNGGVRA